MSKQTRRARLRTATAEAHVERAVSVVTGRPILIRCECPLGHDHTYAEWQERFGREAAEE
ncbi:hypothetical protein KNO15_14550 [Leifsonia shinshuensis]|uniref:hypothetical protein n=1 Tax=Leifsonia shinshuensis TaxID=150026 RepID=UPI001F50AA96|nr:hypothetical protein [Leifsonia shinshuensis]MCI0157916.1 hypothetical protein [Leifsonia shinshuensis]